MLDGAKSELNCEKWEGCGRGNPAHIDQSVSGLETHMDQLCRIGTKYESGSQNAPPSASEFSPPTIKNGKNRLVAFTGEPNHHADHAPT